MAKKISVRKKELLRSRAKGLCEYCQSPEQFSTYDFSADHIIPAGQDGDDDLNNLAFSCQGCNNHKYNKTEAADPVSGQTVPLFHPRKHIWVEHFRWNEDFSEIIGTTPTGRATIEALKLNREKLIALRKGLFLLGEHPPE